MYSKAVRTVLITIASGFLLLIAFVVIVDPFYHYHEPIGSMQMYLYNTVYQSPGLAENYDYDIALLGSSMTENTRPSWYREAGDHPVKIAYSGAMSKDFDLLLGRVFKTHPNLPKVVMDINEYQLSVDPESRFASNDEYLYDDNPFTDVKYIFNKDVLSASAGRLVSCILGVPGNEEDAYTWDDPALFGKEQVKIDYELAMENVNRAFAVSEKTTAEKDEIIRIVSDNIENITKYVKEHPDTEFVFYYPPYSLAYWQSLIENDEAEYTLLRYRTATEILTGFENVKLYSFQNDYEVIENPDLYRDSCHYHPEVNRKIFEIMNSDDDTFLLTSENCDKWYADFEKYIDSADFDNFWN